MSRPAKPENDGDYYPFTRAIPRARSRERRAGLRFTFTYYIPLFYTRAHTQAHGDSSMASTVTVAERPPRPARTRLTISNQACTRPRRATCRANNIRARASAEQLEPGHEDVAQPSILDVSSFLSLKGTRTFGIGLEDSKIRRLERGRGRSGRSAHGAWPSAIHASITWPMARAALRDTCYVRMQTIWHTRKCFTCSSVCF